MEVKHRIDVNEKFGSNASEGVASLIDQTLMEHHPLFYFPTVVAVRLRLEPLLCRPVCRVEIVRARRNREADPKRLLSFSFLFHHAPSRSPPRIGVNFLAEAPRFPAVWTKARHSRSQHELRMDAPKVLRTNRVPIFYVVHGDSQAGVAPGAHDRGSGFQGVHDSNDNRRCVEKILDVDLSRVRNF